jgi:rhamnosyltransferase subunit B
LRILLTTFGSLGDLHPYLAMGTELRSRGHDVALATCASYEDRVRADGLEFVATRPDITPLDTALMAYVMDAKHGSERIVKWLVAETRASYEDTLPAVRGADLVVTHPTTLAAVLALEKLGVPWVSSVLAPLSFFSAYDPPVPAPAPWLVNMRVLGPRFGRGMVAVAKRITAPWMRPVAELRKELGLPPGGHPLLEGQHSPKLVLALFSHCLAAKQPDWPPQTVVTGFPFYDQHEQPLSPELQRFLADGPAPLVFSLGSSAVGAAGDYYIESLKASRQLGMRALFLTGKFPQGLPSDAMAVEYAPHAAVFPHAAAIVHHGGIGTTAQAMRSGRPMLVTPFSHDQFDNGARVKKLGMAEVVYRSKYNARSAAPVLRRLVENAGYREAGARVAAMVRAEHGAKAAADAIEGVQ